MMVQLCTKWFILVQLCTKFFSSWWESQAMDNIRPFPKCFLYFIWKQVQSYQTWSVHFNYTSPQISVLFQEKTSLLIICPNSCIQFDAPSLRQIFGETESWSSLNWNWFKFIYSFIPFIWPPISNVWFWVMLKYNIDRNMLSLDFGFSGGNESRLVLRGLSQQGLQEKNVN